MKCSEFKERLDAYIDGELDENACKEMQNHADSCENCNQQLFSAEALKNTLSHLDDNFSVPLETQAAWRRAVRSEIRKKKALRLYKIAGTVAAAVVLAICLPLMLNSNPQIADDKTIHVEVDGVSDSTDLNLQTEDPATRSVGQVMLMSVQLDAERVVSVENVETAYGYAKDLVQEYAGIIDNEMDDTDEKSIYVQMSAENAEDFINAIDQLGNPSESSYWNASESGTVEICVRLIAE